MRVSSLDSWAGGGAGTSNPGSYGGAGTDVKTSTATITCSTATSCNGRLNANDSVQITFNFTAYPARNIADLANTTNAYQKLRCSGSIIATDVAQPGFLIASGILVTFVESARMSTDGATSGAEGTFGGIAVYTQVPISINRAKPF